MAKPKRWRERREDALSRARIVAEAIALLDQEGEPGLTFRALAARLATGSGAIYWHVANKTELLVAATDAIIAETLGGAAPAASPRVAIRAVARAVFDTVDAHPWVGTQLSRTPWEAATLQIFERIGRQVQALGARGGAQLTAASALVSFIIGVNVQNAAQGRALEPPVDRALFLEREAARWKELSAEEYPFTRKVAAQLRKHDDRAEFLAGIELILAGLEASL